MNEHVVTLVVTLRAHDLADANTLASLLRDELDDASHKLNRSQALRAIVGVHVNHVEAVEQARETDAVLERELGFRPRVIPGLSEPAYELVEGETLEYGVTFRMPDGDAA